MSYPFFNEMHGKTAPVGIMGLPYLPVLMVPDLIRFCQLKFHTNLTIDLNSSINRVSWCNKLEKNVPVALRAPGTGELN